MTFRIGAHVDQRDPVAAARELGANAAQFFLGDPQSWKKPTVAYAAGPDALAADAEAADVLLYVHAPYVINVASTNNRIRIPSRKLLQQTIDGAATINAAGVVVHGGHVGKDDDPAAGFDNWRKCIDGLDCKVPVLIENTAGGANAMARTLERWELLWAAVCASDNAPDVGVTLDTCHAFAGGIDLATAVPDLLAITGRIDLIHANDSKGAANSGVDRHQQLGRGEIGIEPIVALIRAAGCPAVLETPMQSIALDVKLLREQLA